MSRWSERITIQKLTTDAEQWIDRDILVAGWVKSVRTSKNCAFVMINDGSSFQDMQIVVDATDVAFAVASKLLTGYSVAVDGKAVSSPGKQKIEIHLKKLEVVGEVTAEYPLQKKATSLEFLREVAHVRARSNTMNAVFRIRHTVSQAVHRFFDERGYYYAHTPVITSSDCEGAGEMFRVTTLHLDKIKKDAKGVIDFSQDYFGQATYLGVSGQLEGEALALGLGSIYTFGPTFRSENSNTSRHLSEFWMIEPEVAFAELDDVAVLAADFIQYLIKDVLAKHPAEIDFFAQHYKPGLRTALEEVANSTFKRITYTEAVEILLASKKKFDFAVSWGMDLQSEHERFLTDEHFKTPVIVTNYPQGIKAFYMKLDDDGKTVKAMDVLVPGVGEIIGGSERETRLDILESRMKAKGLNVEDYSWYLDLRRFGSAPHAGFGLGFERFIMYVTGMSNIRDVIPFPRFVGSAKF